MQPLVHYGVACDCCGQGPIAGRRYKCGNCPNYDLCEHCYIDNKAVEKHQQGRHIFIVAHRPIESRTNEALLPALVAEAVVVTQADVEREFLQRFSGKDVRAD